jgi:hypothetical protein
MSLDTGRRVESIQTDQKAIIRGQEDIISRQKSNQKRHEDLLREQESIRKKGELKNLLKHALNRVSKSAVDVVDNHNAACKRRHQGTGEWLLKSDDFRKWKVTKGSFLWLYGIRMFSASPHVYHFV